MTASVRIVNDGNCEGDVVRIKQRFTDTRPWLDRGELKLGEVSERMSADGELKLESVHQGPSIGNVHVITIKPGDAEGVAAGVSAYERYCAGVGGTTFDGRALPTWHELGNRQKAGWIAAAGVDSVYNPYMRGAGGA